MHCRYTITDKKITLLLGFEPRTLRLTVGCSKLTQPLSYRRCRSFEKLDFPHQDSNPDLQLEKLVLYPSTMGDVYLHNICAPSLSPLVKDLTRLPKKCLPNQSANATNKNKRVAVVPSVLGCSTAAKHRAQSLRSSQQMDPRALCRRFCVTNRKRTKTCGLQHILKMYQTQSAFCF